MSYYKYYIYLVTNSSGKLHWLSSKPVSFIATRIRNIKSLYLFFKKPLLMFAPVHLVPIWKVKPSILHGTRYWWNLKLTRANRLAICPSKMSKRFSSFKNAMAIFSFIPAMVTWIFGNIWKDWHKDQFKCQGKWDVIIAFCPSYQKIKPYPASFTELNLTRKLPLDLINGQDEILKRI